MNILVLFFLFGLFIVSINTIDTNKNGTKRINETKSEILYTKKLRNLDTLTNKYKTVTSYKSGLNDYHIEIVTRFEEPISSKLYRMPDKIKLTPKNYLETIEFLASNISEKQLVIDNDLKISRFMDPYYVTLIRPVGKFNLKYRIQIFDWLEIKDLISLSSTILYDLF